MGWWRNLRNTIEVWFLTRGVLWAYQWLKGQELGKKLNDIMDKEFGVDKSDVVQKQLLAPWFEEVAKELRA